jgi:DUF4097 and DUF4098 domain-containing protein YvlB
MWVLWFQSALASSVVDTEHPAEPDLEVNIELLCGSVSVRGSARKTVKVTGSVEDPEALHVSALPGRVAIEVDGAGRRGTNCADLVVDVPQHASITAETVSAPVNVLDVAGRLNLETTSAPITVTGAPAAVSATSISGPVTVTGPVPGGVRVETVSGMIRIGGATGKIGAESVSGPIQITTTEGAVSELEAETMSAPITVTARIPSRGDWSLESHTGPLSLTVPSDTNAVVTWATFRGAVSVAGGQGQNQTTLGQGGAQIDLETFTGPISVSRTD